MSIRFFRRLAVVFACVSILAVGCGNPTSEVNAESCQYDFNVHVRSGASAGLSLSGKLSLQENSGGVITGLLKPTGQETDATKFVKVDGSAKGNEVTLNFMLTDGRKITGTGTFPSAPSKCETTTQTITGTLTGPGADDKGDWDAKYLAKLACAATCEFFNLSTTCDLYCSNTKFQTTK